MRRHRILTLIALGLFTPSMASAQSARGRAAPTPRTDQLLRRLTLRQQVAQLVMPWIPGTYVAFDDRALEETVKWVDSLEVGGIIVSVGSPMDIAGKLNFLQRRSKQPLLISSDLEGGTGFRFQGGTPFPTNMGVGASGSERDAYLMGRITALEGRAAGVHLTFSPVADVNNNAANPIINTRSFGSDANAVAALVAASIKGTQDAGMLATAKHFPGHGDTDVDSHISLPIIRADWRRLDSLELVPFRAAIKAGVKAVMSAHIALPAVDKSDPPLAATLVPEILTGILRDSLHFKGLVVTDALNMGALVNVYGPGETAVRAFLAGTDLLLMPSDPRAAIDAMVDAIRSGRIPRARFNASVRRVLETKERLGLFRRRTVNLDNLGAVIGRRAHRDTAFAVSQRALVLVRDSLGLLDSLRAAPRKMVVITYADANSGPVGNTLLPELTKRGHQVTSFRLSATSGPASYDSAAAVLRGAPLALFAPPARFGAWRGGGIAMPEP
ncbi:MAG: beta-N-acetylglucosaminidase, partial [Gemmatimonadales bacterium]|nr:beta-N-acetylglucosaminidase [Gemmatimonadales bacterium]